MSYRGSIDQNRIKNVISSVHKGRTTDVGILKARSAKSEAKLYHKLHEEDYAPGKQQDKQREQSLTEQALREFKRTRFTKIIKGIALAGAATFAVVSVMKRKEGRQNLSRAIKLASKVDPRHLLNPEVMRASELKAKSVVKRISRANRKNRVH